MKIAALIAEVQGHGARVYGFGDRLRIVPPGRLPESLRAELSRRKAELLEVLPPAPPDIAALRAATPPEPWIVSSAGGGAMRLLVDAHPFDWPPQVWGAGALVDILDARYRAGRADADGMADELQALLAALRREGIEAWLAS